MTPLEPPNGQIPAKILVVDDDPAVRMIILGALKQNTYWQVREASDGAVARSMLQQESYDVVITDLVMPGVTGLDLMRWARKSCPGPTWIILSGQASFDDAVKAVRLGAFDFISKPLNVIDSLLVTVRNALRQRNLLKEHEDLEQQLRQRNERLNQQVDQLRNACRMLCDQAETLASDLKRAELIQRALLPQEPPSMPEGWAVNAVYRACHNVGGDLYEVSRIGPKHLLLYVADAAGHGVSAAMLAVLFKHRLHLIDEKTLEPTEPAEILRRVNQSLFAECTGPGLFVSAIMGVLDMESGELRLASAGHPPALLHRRGGEVELLNRTGPALGIMSEANFTQNATKLNPGDRLLLYTDGIYETQRDQQGLDCEKLAARLKEYPDGHSEMLQDLLVEANQNLRQESPQDDITLVLLSADNVPSCIDNDQPPSEISLDAPEPVNGDSLLIGRSETEAVMQIIGRATFVQAPTIHDTALSELKAGRHLQIDLTRCTYLDSTMLGTMQELTSDSAQEKGKLSFYTRGSTVRSHFEELGMIEVLNHFTSEMTPMPKKVEVLEISGEFSIQHNQRMLHAHEALAHINEQNQEEFAKLINQLRYEIARHESQHPE